MTVHDGSCRATLPKWSYFMLGNHYGSNIFQMKLLKKKNCFDVILLSFFDPPPDPQGETVWQGSLRM